MPEPRKSGDPMVAFMRDTERQLNDLAARSVPPSIARGIVKRLRIPSTSSAYSAGNTTDFAIADVPTDDTRQYELGVHTEVSITDATTWIMDFYVDGSQVDRVWERQIVAGSGGRGISETWLWEPTSGVKDIDLRVGTGGGTITFLGGSTKLRWFWVKDIGPRPT